MKKAISVLLSVCLVVTLGSVCGLSASALESGDYTYTVQDGKATITKYTGTGGNITIPNQLNGLPVTAIGMEAFYENADITGVSIPDGITEIGESAFYWCYKLKSVTLGKDVSVIGAQAFEYDNALKSIVFPESLTTIGAYAFSCYGMAAAFFLGDYPTFEYPYDTFPGSMGGTFIYYYKIGSAGWTEDLYTKPFSPDKLNTVVYHANGASDGIVPVDEHSYLYSTMVPVSGNTGNLSKSNATFAGWNTKADGTGTDYNEASSILIHDRNITLYAKWDRDLTPGSAQQWVNQGITWNYTPLGTNFCRIDGATSAVGELTIPSTINGREVYSIGSNAFMGNTALTSVTLPDSTVFIEDGAFKNCTGLTKINMGENIANINGTAFEGCSGLTTVTLPDSLTDLYNDVFLNCTGLTSVCIGRGTEYINSSAFRGCTRLTEIAVNENNNSFSSLEGVLFNQSKTVLYQYPCGKNGGYRIPEGVTVIDEDSFINCTGLTKVTVPAGVTVISYFAFYNCANLAAVSFLGDAPEYISKDSFIKCAANFTINYIQGKSGFYSYFPNPWYGSSIQTFIPLTAPTGLNAAKIATTVTLSWTPVSGATGYDVYMDKIKITSVPVSETSYTVTGLSENNAYIFSVKAVNDKTESLVCDGITVTPTSYIPGDTNGDGQLSLMDVTVLSRYIAGWAGLSVQIDQSDVSGDGKINLMDITMLSRYIAGWDIVLH